MFDILYRLTGARREHDAYQQHMAVLQAQADCARREFEENRHAYYATDPSIIDVEARVVEDMPALPAPKAGVAP